MQIVTDVLVSSIGYHTAVVLGVSSPDPWSPSDPEIPDISTDTASCGGDELLGCLGSDLIDLAWLPGRGSLDRLPGLGSPISVLVGASTAEGMLL